MNEEAPYGYDEDGEPTDANDAPFHQKPIVKVSSACLFDELNGDLDMLLAFSTLDRQSFVAARYVIVSSGSIKKEWSDLWQMHKKQRLEDHPNDVAELGKLSNAIMWGARRVYFDLLTDPEALRRFEDAKRILANEQAA